VFDKLAEAEPPIVRESGDIVRCFDDYCDDIQVRGRGAPNTTARMDPHLALTASTCTKHGVGSS
jgi:hypothetical protein